MTTPDRRPLRRPLRRPNMRRAVILFPSGFTLGNLFFGIFAIIAASRLEFTAAGVYVMLGGICDALDGRVARATNSGTEFGEELDSLVDAISFGLAPAMIMYFAVLNRDGWDWVWVFTFAAAAVLRLARFNIEQAGTAKTYFQGLPSPAAGITLASYYWFSQSSLYEYGAIADLKWHVLLRYLMAMLSFLMISNVPYPTFPRMGFRSIRGIGASLVMIGGIALLLTRRLEYFFPLALAYIAWGLLRWVFFGLFERRQPTMPYDLSEGEDDEDEDEDETFQISDSRVHASKQGHREDVPARHDRMRGRASRLEGDTPATRPERPRRPERSERPERGERAERTDRLDRTERTATAERGAERGPDGERGRRDRKKERSKSTDRPERSERSDRPERGERPPRAPRPEPAPPVTAAPTPILTGVDAITLGEPANPSAGDEELLSDEDGNDESGADITAESGAAALAGAPARKRKRRRRRGERKERTGSETAFGGGSDIASAGAPPESIAPSIGDGGSDASDVDRSPYASSPSVASTPTPPAPAPAAPPASPPPLPPSPSPSSEPTE